MSERLRLAWDDRAVVRCVLTAAGPLWFAFDLLVGVCDCRGTSSTLAALMPRGTRLARLVDVYRYTCSVSRMHLLTTAEVSLLAETGEPKLQPLCGFVCDVGRRPVVLSGASRNGSRDGRFAQPGEEGSVTLSELCRPCVDDDVPASRVSVLFPPMPLAPKGRTSRNAPTPTLQTTDVPYACGTVCWMDDEEPVPFEYESPTGATFLYEPVAGGPADREWEVAPVVVRTDSRFHVFVPRRVDV